MGLFGREQPGTTYASGASGDALDARHLQRQWCLSLNFLVVV